MGNRLLVATPVRGGDLHSTSISVGYVEFIRALQQSMPVDTLSPILTYNCDNIRARNRIAATVLREPDFAKVTHVLWCDDDNWPEDSRIVKEMMALGEDFVAAPYTNKRKPLRWVHQILDHRPAVDENGLMEVRGVGFGFTMTSRACLEKMSNAARRYTDTPNPHKVANIFGQLYDRFTPGEDPEDECLLSEDFSFCKRWREMGGKIHLYAKSGIIIHAGPHPFSARDMPGGVIAG